MLDSSWRVSHLDNGADALLGCSPEGPGQAVPFSGPIMASCLPACVRAPLPLWSWAFGELMAPLMGFRAARVGYYLGFLHIAVVSLGSFVGVRMGFSYVI